MGAELQGTLAGRHAFVAGGTSGINLGIAEALSRAGANLTVMSRDLAKVNAAVAVLRAAGGAACGWTADVRNYEAVDAALGHAYDRLGPIDVLVSGAAGNFLAPALGLSPNAFRAVVDIDLIGTFHVFKAGYPRLRRPGASLIAVSAPQGAHAALLQSHACAAKAGVNMLVRCLALEWGPAGVRVNAISPGPVPDTEGMARLAAGQDAALCERIALRRLATCEDIADAALFLAGEGARYVTGSVLDVDGGLGVGDAGGDALTVPAR